MHIFAQLKRLLLILLLLSLVSCEKTVEIPAVEWCSSVGRFGATCQDSIDRERRRLMDLEAWVEFLAAVPDDPRTPLDESKGPALCASSEDFARLQTALEQLCYKAGKYCTLEQRELIAALKENASAIKQEALTAASEEEAQGRTAPATGKSK